VRTNRYKLIHFYGVDEWELYDLEKDPSELRNIYDDPANAALINELKSEIKRLRDELEVPEDEEPAREVKRG
jgi:arylsulfatase A-like enzyme